ncbi:taste receptor type 2 member 40-like [Rana temporaria]|uniref:taste receptor type 2 member 40-like n=1 Tax=Rana temporaria TaxID=8407 RepID=UPI001AACCE79|nr:taste receptor type 2 member 40-like [Rana temporaria]
MLFYIVIPVVLGLVLAIPSNTCIVMGNLDIIRKKGKLSPSDVIFLGKGIVNILLQCLFALKGMFFHLPSAVLSYTHVYLFVIKLTYFLTYYNFWLTFWLSAHYCTSITNPSYGFFIWIKRIVSNFLSHLLFLTALGVFIVNVLTIGAFNGGSPIQSPENSTEISISVAMTNCHVNYYYLVPANFLGVVLPFCLSLLCLVLTFSFLLRHVWRVKNNDSGSTRPNLQAHVTALRTIFFLLLMLVSFSVSEVLSFLRKCSEITNQISMVSWAFRLVSPSAEAVIIFQASNKLKRIILRRFWTRSSLTP